MSDVIRTEAALGWWFDGSQAAKRAKKLEGELNEANERIKRLEEAGKHLRQTSSDKRACDAWDQLNGSK